MTNPKLYSLLLVEISLSNTIERLKKAAVAGVVIVAVSAAVAVAIVVAE